MRKLLLFSVGLSYYFIPCLRLTKSSTILSAHLLASNQQVSLVVIENVTNVFSPKWALLERCVHLMRERQIYLKFVGPFVAIHFYIPINKVIRCYPASFMTWCFCLYHFVFLTFPPFLFLLSVFLTFRLPLSFCLNVFLLSCLAI